MTSADRGGLIPAASTVDRRQPSILTAITPLGERLDPAAQGRAWVSWDPEWAYVLPADDDAVALPGGESPA
jgi:hypothetical protein